jgi:hypothetical protein
LGKVEEGVADAEAALKHGPRTHRLVYNASRIYAQAAAAVQTAPGVPATRMERYEARARELLGQALGLLPAGQRPKFWGEVVLQDNALALLRRRPAFAALAPR